MKGSGLKEVWSLIYAEKSTEKMLDFQLLTLMLVDSKAKPDEQTILEKLEANSTVMKAGDAVGLQMNVVGERGKTS
ncbi:hypothetical protein KQX54_000576 [Cotesia glomerata]|uniref:Uncharacterized protein n=1 Tax=Cotesia glomerata TaxID=32391 RepID=A0AAV7HGM1_COTGL|nr:hypothetical protein KQX54_000576 [Cotesia glomerata]